MEFILQDKELFLYLNNLGNPAFDAFWSFVSGKFSWIPLYAALLYLLYKNFTPRQLLYIILLLALGIAFSDQLAGVFKRGFLRLRPCHDEALIPYMRIVECGGKYGFYSSHASNTFFLAAYLSSLLGVRYRFLTLFLFIWAAVVSYSRIYSLGRLQARYWGELSLFCLIGFPKETNTENTFQNLLQKPFLLPEVYRNEADVPPMRLNVPPMRQNIPPMRLNVPPLRQNVPPLRLKASTMRQNVLTIRKKAPTMRLKASTMRQNVLTIRKKASTKR